MSKIEIDEKYFLPCDISSRVSRMRADYNILNRKYEEIKTPGISYGIRVQTSELYNPVEDNAMRLIGIRKSLDKINAAFEAALKQIPEEYKKCVWENFIKGKEYPQDLSIVQCSLWQERFWYYVAQHMKWI